MLLDFAKLACSFSINLWQYLKIMLFFKSQVSWLPKQQKTSHNLSALTSQYQL